VDFAVRGKTFSIHVEDEVLSDLRRASATALARSGAGAAGARGPISEYLTAVLAYWGGESTGGARERELKRFKAFRAELDGVSIHFVHERARDGTGFRASCRIGWPSSFADVLPLVPW